MPSPTLLYLHRYPIERESIQFAGLQSLLHALKTEFNVVYMSFGGKNIHPSPQLRDGIAFHELPAKIAPCDPCDKWLKTALYYSMLPLILGKIKKIAPDVILCKETLPWIPSLVARLNRPMLIDVSDWWASILLGHSAIGRPLALRMEQSEIRDWQQHRTLALTHTEAESRILTNAGFPLDRIRITEVPHPQGKYRPCNASDIRRKFGWGENDWVAALHGIMHPSKGYDEILDWWEALTQSHPNWKLLLIGGGGLESRYRKRVAESSRLGTSVFFTGWLESDDDVNSFLNAADCLLVTRRNSPENTGVVPSALHHCLMIGKPTVITGLPGLSEFIAHGQTGYAFEPGSFESFRQTLEQISSSPDEAKAVGERGRIDASKRFSPEKMAAQYLAAALEIARM